MKTAAKFGRRAVLANAAREAVMALWPLAALACCRAAQRDEKRGFEFAAAMEWRHAAELLTLVPAASDYCWTQWERVMRLPRALASPIGETDSHVTVMRTEVATTAWANVGRILPLAA